MSHNVRWTAEKIVRRLRLIAPLVYQRHAYLSSFRFRRLPGPEAPSPIGPDVDDRDWSILEPETFWGEREMEFAMRTEFQRPAEWDPTVPTALFLPLGDAPDFAHPEALVHIDGEAWAAVDRYHREVWLDARWLDGRPHLLALRGFTGIWLVDQNGQSTPMQLFLGRPALVQLHLATRDFIATARVALETVQSLDDDHPARWRLLDALDDAFNHLETREPLGDDFYASVPGAHERLRAGIEQAGPAHPAVITATGHAHLDLAWLWTVRQTRRKAERTFWNVMRLMERFEDYHFTQSQPQLYEFVRQDDPKLFAAIKARVQEGRWEPLGGMWVEADCNLSGPESLARQLLLGQRYLREHFGDAAAPVLWLPDVFGYAWNLPQLMKLAGLDYFFTIKIGWSQYNRLPYDSFWWQGVDGTRVLTHFSTTPEAIDFPSHGSYNAVLSPWSALATWRNFQQKGAQDELLMSFGYGDGGGGPDPIMLENMAELSDFPAVPSVRPGSVGDFFRRMEADSGDKLPTWNGELYLELHRGTYTSQSRNKRANRKSEFLLHDAEFLAALAAVLDANYRYPHSELAQAWQLVCLNQFHDIIPGSSIHQVYVDSLQQYEEVADIGRSIRDRALQAVGEQVGGDFLLVNPTAFRRQDLVCWPGHLPDGRQLVRPDGRPLPGQPTTAGTLFAPGELAPYSVTALQVAPEAAALPSTELIVSPTRLENRFLRVDLNEAGDIIGLYDRRVDRQILPPGAVANQFQAFEDRPLNWDAWDIDLFYEDRMWLSEPADDIRVVEEGPLRATLEIHRRILHSSYVQRISLDYNSASLRFDTTIHWRERHTLLKVAFPVDILSPVATYEIQWGNVQRPTHRNTSWDWARFESCAQKWVDLSEGDYGVSLLNDCKYGHDIHNNVIRLTLLRSPTHPDPEADQGEHHLVYSLLPHRGTWNEETIEAAYSLNDPLILTAGSGDDGALAEWRELSLLTVDRPNVIIETVKQAEDGDGIIVRLYEAMRQRGPVTLSAACGLKAVFITNLLEENEDELPVVDKLVRFDLRPYQIMTLRLVPERPLGS